LHFLLAHAHTLAFSKEVTDMADDILTKALAKVDDAAAQLAKAQSFVNQLDEFEGRPPRFPDVGTIGAINAVASQRSNAQQKWQPGDFFGKSFSGACRMVLLARHETLKGPLPASVDEIHDALSAGSFKFEGNGAEAQKNSIRISLGKNSQTFVRLPGTDLFGLVEWYPGMGGKKSGRKSATGKESVSAEDEEGTAAEGDEAGAADPLV